MGSVTSHRWRCFVTRDNPREWSAIRPLPSASPFANWLDATHITFPVSLRCIDIIKRFYCHICHGIQFISYVYYVVKISDKVSLIGLLKSFVNSFGLSFNFLLSILSIRGIWVGTVQKKLAICVCLPSKICMKFYPTGANTRLKFFKQYETFMQISIKWKLPMRPLVSPRYVENYSERTIYIYIYIYTYIYVLLTDQGTRFTTSSWTHNIDLNFMLLLLEKSWSDKVPISRMSRQTAELSGYVQICDLAVSLEP